MIGQFEFRSEPTIKKLNFKPNVFRITRVYELVNKHSLNAFEKKPWEYL